MSQVCIINSSQPAYQPNIYLCDSATTTCCVNRGQPACCETDVTARQMFDQMLPMLIIFTIIWLVAAMVWWYFNDDDVDHEEALKDNGPGGVTRSAIEFAMPKDSDLNVEDPVYGQLYESRIPRYANVGVDGATTVRLRYVNPTKGEHIA
ncbi:unnamed protein product [Caenorhabditis auriculariae]|uniref:Uncharacterized protein n=1 Tax=Caenorhabditis auriculariae TaxID=2777116 RepID=A0A8S1HJM6_9PELO|nr:unnamed protein product [Caenorhabditis auriculariae]